MTREEALRRIERAAGEKLMKLDLSGLQLEPTFRTPTGTYAD